MMKRFRVFGSDKKIVKLTYEELKLLPLKDDDGQSTIFKVFYDEDVDFISSMKSTEIKNILKGALVEV